MTPCSEAILLADLGIAVLLFLVGLRLDVHLIRVTGRVALVTGLGQVVFTSLVGYALALALGLEPLAALYVAVALTFSSTIIIVKLLSDKRELEDLHGRIAVGFLIVQDIVVVVVMIGLSAFVGTGQSFGAALALVALKGTVFLGAVVAVSRYVFPRLLPALARLPELLVLAAIAWAVALAAIGDELGFSREVGAFLGGVSLASTPYREAIAARLVTLRDFLLVFFFIDFGARIQVEAAGSQIVSALVLSAFVLIGNPIIVMVLMGAMGYRKRVSFLAGLTVAQISEFSLILAALGLFLGHIGSETVSLVTVVGLITIGLSTYLILYSHPLYRRLAPALSVFERRRHRPHPELTRDEVDVVVLGVGRHGSRLAEGLTAEGLRVLAVDHDPEVLRRAERAGLPTLYGDAGDPELALALPTARRVAVTMRTATSSSPSSTDCTAPVTRGQSQPSLTARRTPSCLRKRASTSSWSLAAPPRRAAHGRSSTASARRRKSGSARFAGLRGGRRRGRTTARVPLRSP